jgi:hypothetical protein
MRRYHFDLVDTTSVTDANGAILDSDEQAIKVARDIVHEVRETRPELLGHGYEVLVRADNGQEIWRTAVDRPADGSNGGQDGRKNPSD